MSNEKSGLEKFKLNYTSRVQKKIEEVFNIKTLKDLELVEEQLHWDSMAILSLIAACESEYQIIIENHEYIKI